METSLSEDKEFQEFKQAASQGNLVPMYERLFSDQLTPVLAYRCLVDQTDRESPSFLFESVTNGDQTVSKLHYDFLSCIYYVCMPKTSERRNVSSNSSVGSNCCLRLARLGRVSCSQRASLT